MKAERQSSEIYFLFPPTVNRIKALECCLQGENCPERYLLYGLDWLHRHNILPGHNLCKVDRFSHFAGHFFRRLIVRVGGYPGDLEWLLANWRGLRRGKRILVFSDRAVFPLLYMRMLKTLPRAHAVYIAVGLPEKLASFKNTVLRKRVLGELGRLGHIVTLSEVEAEELQQRWGLLANVSFVPAGVDVDYFCPQDIVEDIDVVSIGADPFRDFETLFAAARLLKDKTFLVITTKAHASGFTDVPANVSVKLEVPMDLIRAELGRGKVIALPVKDNTYSGGTTVMLQAMAMGKAVVANRIGANRSGYGFTNRTNCVLVEPEVAALTNAIEELLVDHSFRGSIGHAARVHIERNLSIDTFHAHLQQLLKIEMSLSDDR